MRRFAAGLSLLFSLLGIAQGQTPKTAPAFFPVSVWYGGGKARAPMLEPVGPESRRLWREDLAKIKALGFNTVRTWVEWSAGEPVAGQYHLEQLDLMLSLAQEVGLKVMVQVYVDSAPDWVGEKFPDGKFVAQNGMAIPSQAAPGFCTDHSGVRQAMANFYREVAKHAEKSPAFFGFDLWSEPHVINWAIIDYIPDASFCYCPYTLARFRQWLQAKYGTLAALNQAWYRQFRDWSQVEPPRFGTILSYTDYMDWRVFITEKLAEDLAFRNHVVKEIVPAAVTSSHSAVPGVFTSLADGDGNPDDWLMYRAVDYYGLSMYPKHSYPASHWSVARRALALDFTRSAGGNRGFYVGELQGGFGVRGVVVSQEVTPADLEEYAWAAVARGARALNFYAFYPMSSGYESGGYGLINLDGTLTERSRRAGQVAQAIAENAGLLLAAHPPRAEVAILFNHMATLVGGYQNSGNRASERDAVAGYHRMFLERNVPVDFISARELDPSRLPPYKLVVVPYPILMTKAVAAALEQYVRQGGRLFVEARPGWVDERGYAQAVIPGFGWEKVFGVREASVTPRAEFRVRWGATEFAAGTFEERFTVLDPAAQVVAQFADGSPAAYEHKYGRGSAVILGAFAGQPNESKPQEMHPLGEALVRWAGVTLPALRSTAPIEVQEMQAPAGKLVFFFNHGSMAAELAYLTPVPKAPAHVRELTSVEKVPFTSTVSGSSVSLELQLPPQGVRVFRIE